MAVEWPEVRFEQLLTEPVRNGIYKEKEFHGRGAKIVNMGELFAYPRLRAVQMRRVELSESEADRFLIARGDLLFARRSLVAEGAGKCSVVLDVDEPTTFESSIIRARPDGTKADSRYLYYFFNSPLGLYHLDTIRRQVAVAGITGGDLAKLEITIPPLAEQRAIAHILGTLDEKIELNRQMSETLEAMARALFKSWFVDFDPVRAKAEGRDPGLPQPLADLFPDSFEDSELGEIPRGWRKGSFGDFISQRTERVGPRQVVVLSAVAGGKLVRSDDHFTKRVYSKDTGKYLLVEQWDFAYNPSRINIGSIGMLEEASLGGVSPVYVVARPTPAYRWFLEFSLRRPQTKTWINTLASGSVRQSLTYAAFASIPCVVPPKAVTLEFNQTWSTLREGILARTAGSHTLAALRDTLLPKLVSGELRLTALKRFVSGRGAWQAEVS